MAADVDRIMRQHAEMRANHDQYVARWAEIQELCCPNRGSFYESITAPANLHVKVYDGTPIRALNICAAGLHGQLSSTHRPFFTLKPDDLELYKLDHVKEWYEFATKDTMAALQGSSWNAAMHEHYLDYASIATACIYSEENKYNPGEIWFSTEHMGGVYISLNDYGAVDTVHLRRQFTARQAVQKFGLENLSGELQEAFKAKPETTFYFIHRVAPRELRDEQRRDSINLPFESVWLEEKTRKIVRESGYEEFPFSVPRWSVAPGEIYGRGPGTDALADMKMLQQKAKAQIRGEQLAVEPPIDIPASGYMMPLSLIPGGRNVRQPGTQERIERLDIAGNIVVGEDSILRLQNAIKETFYNNLFLMLDQFTGNITATEALERVQEKIQLLGPTVGRHRRECLDPQVTRAFKIRFRAGKIPPPPPEVIEAGGGFDIEFASQLDISQRGYEVNSITKYYQIVGGIAQLKPEVLDIVDGDATARELAELVGMPATLVNDEAQVEKIRQARMEAAQAEQMKSDMERAAAGARDAGGALKDLLNA